MYKKFLACVAIAAAASYAASAGAMTVTPVAANVPADTGFGNTVGATPTQVTFDEVGVTAAPPNSVTANLPASIGTATFAGNGIIVNNPAGPIAGMYAPPITAPLGVGIPDTTNYLAVVPDPNPSSGNLSSPVTVTLPGSFFQFGLLWGSIDTYNTITFSNDSESDSVTGIEIVNPANGNQGIGGTFYVLFTSDVAFNTVILASTSNSLEVDNLFWGRAAVEQPVPLPGALPLFVSGLGSLGFFGFWRKRKQKQKQKLATA
jgi:hypothetical protein